MQKTQLLRHILHKYTGTIYVAHIHTYTYVYVIITYVCIEKTQILRHMHIQAHTKRTC